MNFEYCEGKMHVIKEGDTLYQLSRQHNVPLALILRANPFVDVYNLQVGDEICIPTMVGRPPQRPDMGMGMSPNSPQQPSMGMPTPPNRPQQPDMGMPMPPNRPQQPDMGIPNNPNNLQPNMELPERSSMQNLSNDLRSDNRLLKMPSFQNIFTYTIENDDSLEDILDEFEISLEELLNFNELDDIMLLPGSKVKVPVRRDRDDD